MFQHTCAYLFVYTCVYVFAYTCVYVFAYTCVYVFAYTCVYVFAYTWAYVFAYTCVYLSGKGSTCFCAGNNVNGLPFETCQGSACWLIRMYVCIMHACTWDVLAIVINAYIHVCYHTYAYSICVYSDKPGVAAVLEFLNCCMCACV